MRKRNIQVNADTGLYEVAPHPGRMFTLPLFEYLGIALVNLSIRLARWADLWTISLDLVVPKKKKLKKKKRKL